MAQNTNKNCAVNKGDGLQVAMWQIPWWQALNVAGNSDWCQSPQGGSKWVLTRIDAASVLGFVIDKTAQSVITEPE